ncbi:hypothetical protein LCGC14_1976180 [marine sediment metagenome]|uniref:Uncharacterized protein n=1 Tax=marine sediment metagenome TaxID=412755 RepID=A0A0F9FAC2_9ZZZZ
MGTYKKYIGKSIEIREGNTYVGDQQFDIPTNPLDQHSIYFELTKICIGRKVEDLCEEDETKDQFRTNCSIYAHGITTGNGFYESDKFLVSKKKTIVGETVEVGITIYPQSSRLSQNNIRGFFVEADAECGIEEDSLLICMDISIPDSMFQSFLIAIEQQNISSARLVVTSEMPCKDVVYEITFLVLEKGTNIKLENLEFSTKPLVLQTEDEQQEDKDEQRETLENQTYEQREQKERQQEMEEDRYSKLLEAIKSVRASTGFVGLAMIVLIIMVYMRYF